MPSVFVGDGFDLKGELPGMEGLYPATRFTYRTARGQQLFRWQATPWQAQESVAAEIVCGHLTEFEAQNDDGTWEKLTFNVESAQTMHPNILLGVLNHILGYMKPVVRVSLPKSPGGTT